MTEPRPLLRTEVENGRVVVRLAGEIDLSNVDGLEAQIDRAIADAQDVVVDLSAIDFIDSRGLRLLRRVSVAVAAREGTLLVVAPASSVARSVLDMTGMSQELSVHDSV
jgi:anti-sigma B factor antagonist